MKWSESHSVVSNSLWPRGVVHGILQERILEWVTFPFSRESSQPRDQTQVSRIAGRFFTSWIFLFYSKVWSEHMALEGTILKQLRQLSGESSHHWPSFRKLELQDHCFAKCDVRTTCIRILQWCFWNYRKTFRSPNGFSPPNEYVVISNWHSRRNGTPPSEGPTKGGRSFLN